jgi:hypothetical protein
MAIAHINEENGLTYYTIGDRIVEQVVIESIGSSFPTNADSILQDLKWSSINGCYYFERWGMWVGCEVDGYIHS